MKHKIVTASNEKDLNDQIAELNKEGFNPVYVTFTITLDENNVEKYCIVMVK